MKTLRLVLGLWLATAIVGLFRPARASHHPPGWTVTPSLSPTPEATFTPTITHTDARHARQRREIPALFNGDYDTAFLHYQIALQDSPDPSIRASAKWGEARIYYAQERYNETLTPLQVLITEYPQSPHSGRHISFRDLSITVWKIIRRRRCLAGVSEPCAPAVIDAYAQELRGDALVRRKTICRARAAYQAAIQAAPSAMTRSWI
jgi:predicted Zn-dependent protease